MRPYEPYWRLAKNSLFRGILSMKKISSAVLILAMASAVFAEETRTEIVNSGTPADDAKPNSAQVPEVYAIQGDFQRIVVLRFKYQTDLLAGLERMVQEQKIKNAVILTAVGSVRSYQFHVASSRTFPSKNMFVKNPDGCADIVGMSGYVLDGHVHPHIMFGDATRAFGGHLDPGTSVFTFAAITLGVMENEIDFKRLDDKNYR